MEREFSCPYCGVSLTLKLDQSGGKRQEFFYDCEICCRAIHLRFVLEGGEVLEFEAEREE